ncbi:MAG: GtrA family protein [Pseudomonadota bacterium]
MLRTVLNSARSANALVQFSRYLLVGGAAFVVDFGIYYVLLYLLQIHYLLAASLAFIAGTGVNYLLSTSWVFDYRRLSNAKLELTVFAAIGMCGLLLNASVLWVLVSQLSLGYLQAKLAAAGLILFFNFSARKALLFSALPPPSRPGQYETH